MEVPIAASEAIRKAGRYTPGMVTRAGGHAGVRPPQSADPAHEARGLKILMSQAIHRSTLDACAEVVRECARYPVSSTSRMRSAAGTSRTFANRRITVNVGTFSPRSRKPRYVGFMSAFRPRSARVQPRASRKRRTIAPNRLAFRSATVRRGMNRIVGHVNPIDEHIRVSMAHVTTSPRTHSCEPWPHEHARSVGASVTGSRACHRVGISWLPATHECHAGWDACVHGSHTGIRSKPSSG